LGEVFVSVEIDLGCVVLLQLRADFIASIHQDGPLFEFF
jgi:hypothetical protein